MKVYDLKETITLMKSALQEPDTRAADIETVREALLAFKNIGMLDDIQSIEIQARKALAALDRLEGK